jgi:hypothetical protein
VLDAAWIYLLSRGYGSGGAVPDKISDVQYLGPDQLLVEERDDDRPTEITNFYRADFSNATNLLTPGPAKTEADNTVAPTLEMEPSLPASITPAATSLLVDFDQLLAGAGFVNSKIEGAATLGARGANPGLFVGVNDNDFDLDHTVGLAPTAIPEQVDVFALP